MHQKNASFQSAQSAHFRKKVCALALQDFGLSKACFGLFQASELAKPLKDDTQLSPHTTVDSGGSGVIARQVPRVVCKRGVTGHRVGKAGNPPPPPPALASRIPHMEVL